MLFITFFVSIGVIVSIFSHQGGCGMVLATAILTQVRRSLACAVCLVL